ncbi:hypothetical protein PBOI14_46390 [Pseudomonas sp. Boi14]|nr:hypothetical protein PBOI14_46390 [Pseudomonas sp. Boi14]
MQIRWSGALTYGAADQQAPDTDEPTAETSTQWLDRAGVGQLEPHLQVLPERARYAPGEGSLDPVAATRTLLDAACTHGARMFDQTQVLGLRVEGQRVLGVNTAAGLHRADQVLLASGCATPALLAPLGIQLPVQASPSILIRINAPPGLVKTLVSNSQLEIREAADGSLLLAEDYIDAQGPQGPRPSRNRPWPASASCSVAPRPSPCAAWKSACGRCPGPTADYRPQHPLPGPVPGGDARRRDPGPHGGAPDQPGTAARANLRRTGRLPTGTLRLNTSPCRHTAAGPARFHGIIRPRLLSSFDCTTS